MESVWESKRLITQQVHCARSGPSANGNPMAIDAITFAADTAKEFIAFSTAILTLTATFAKDTFLAKRTTAPVALGVSWVMYLLCVFFGLWTMMALTGEVGAAGGAQPDIYGSNVRIPSALMALSFVIGLLFTAAAGWSAVYRLTRNEGQKDL